MAGLDVPVYSAPLQMIVTERAPPLVEQLVAHADRHLSLKQLAAGGSSSAAPGPRATASIGT